MDDNTKVMLKLATLLAQQNNARVNNTPEQNPLTELATQLLMNSANETLAIPTSMQLNPAKQPQPQHDEHNSNSYATQAMTTSQTMDASNHIGDTTYETSHNQRVDEGDIKPVANRTADLVAKDMITLAPPVNRDSYGIVSPAIGDSSESYSLHSPVLKNDFNSKPTNSLLNPSTMNRDMFTSSDCRDSYTSTGNQGDLFPSPSSSNRDAYTASSIANDAQQPLDRNSLTTSLDRETYCNSVVSRDNFNLSQDNNTAMAPVTCDSFSSNCSVTRDSSFSDNSPILRDAPINREAYTNNLMMNQDNYLNTNMNRGSFNSNNDSFPMNSPNRSEENVNMMRNDLSNNSSVNRIQEDMSIDHGDDDGMGGMSNINSSMCNINPSAGEMPVNSNNCAYYKRPIQGEKGRSYPQPVMLRSRPRPAKERSKRGPKEKDYFRTAFFCLPSVTSRLPRFTSADPREQELVYEYQKKGYGFPAKDFFEGKPQKTYIRLSHDEESFRCFLLSIYPKLEGKYYELYRIDRQRNLVRIEAKTPRGIKNAKYQGTIIILPYPEASNPPSAVVHNPSSLGEFPNQLMEESIDDIDDIDEEEGSFIQSPSISGSTPRQSPAVLQANEIAAYKEENYQNFPPSPERDIKPFQKFEKEHSEFFQRISLIKQTLSETRNLKMDKRSIVGNLLELYRCEQTICNYDIRVTFNNDHNLSSSNDPAFQTRHMFCIFWEKIFDKNFVGNMEFYPVINPEADEDMFEVLGRILAHGLILCNYWPIQFALSSATFMLSNECSNELTLKSFINCLSGFEQRVVECAIQESQSQASERYISLDLKKDLSAFLWMYGCEMDKSRHFSDILLCIAKSLLIYQPYWALVKLKEGMDHCCSRIFMACSQSDVQSLYQALTPEASQMCKLIKYEYSVDDNQEIEKELQTYLEKLLWELCSAELSNLLQQWTGVNCMSQQTLFVKFVSGVENVHFENYKCLLRIPRKSITFEEFKKLIKLILDDT